MYFAGIHEFLPLRRQLLNPAIAPGGQSFGDSVADDEFALMQKDIGTG
jgi:hypothetical protein